MSSRARSRSPGASRRRSISPRRSPPRQSSSRSHRDGGERTRDSYRSSDRYPGERPEREYERERSAGGGSSRRQDERRGDRHRDERGGERDRDRGGERRRQSPPPRQSGDGGWGARASGGGGGEVRERSPGRPSASLPSQRELAFGKEGDDGDEKKKVAPIEPNFAPSGALAAETNTLRGVVLKYNEPPEARKPIKSWRIYVFKGKEQVDMFHVHRQSAYLFGRDRIVADIPVDHPSTSKQHAVLQFRQVTERNELGDTKSLTKPFVIDLESANGTTVNDETVPPSRYYELKSGDVVKFAFSTREYVLITE